MQRLQRRPRRRTRNPILKKFMIWLRKGRSNLSPGMKGKKDITLLKALLRLSRERERKRKRVPVVSISTKGAFVRKVGRLCTWLL